jgi:hypothetical protein
MSGGGDNSSDDMVVKISHFLAKQLGFLRRLVIFDLQKHE